MNGDSAKFTGKLYFIEKVQKVMDEGVIASISDLVSNFNNPDNDIRRAAEATFVSYEEQNCDLLLHALAQIASRNLLTNSMVAFQAIIYMNKYVTLCKRCANIETLQMLRACLLELSVVSGVDRRVHDYIISTIMTGECTALALEWAPNWTGLSQHFLRMCENPEFLLDGLKYFNEVIIHVKYGCAETKDFYQFFALNDALSLEIRVEQLRAMLLVAARLHAAGQLDEVLPAVITAWNALPNSEFQKLMADVFLIVRKHHEHVNIDVMRYCVCQVAQRFYEADPATESDFKINSISCWWNLCMGCRKANIIFVENQEVLVTYLAMMMADPVSYPELYYECLSTIEIMAEFADEEDGTNELFANLAVRLEEQNIFVSSAFYAQINDLDVVIPKAMAYMGHPSEIVRENGISILQRVLENRYADLDAQAYVGIGTVLFTAAESYMCDELLEAIHAWCTHAASEFLMEASGKIMGLFGSFPCANTFGCVTILASQYPQETAPFLVQVAVPHFIATCAERPDYFFSCIESLSAIGSALGPPALAEVLNQTRDCYITDLDCLSHKAMTHVFSKLTPELAAQFQEPILSYLLHALSGTVIIDRHAVSSSLDALSQFIFIFDITEDVFGAIVGFCERSVTVASVEAQTAAWNCLRSMIVKFKERPGFAGYVCSIIFRILGASGEMGLEWPAVCAIFRCFETIVDRVGLPEGGNPAEITMQLFQIMFTAISQRTDDDEFGCDCDTDRGELVELFSSICEVMLNDTEVPVLQEIVARTMVPDELKENYSELMTFYCTIWKLITEKTNECAESSSALMSVIASPWFPSKAVSIAMHAVAGAMFKFDTEPATVTEFIGMICQYLARDPETLGETIGFIVLYLLSKYKTSIPGFVELVSQFASILPLAQYNPDYWNCLIAVISLISSCCEIGALELAQGLTAKAIEIINHDTLHKEELISLHQQLEASAQSELVQAILAAITAKFTA